MYKGGRGRIYSPAKSVSSKGDVCLIHEAIKTIFEDEEVRREYHKMEQRENRVKDFVREERRKREEKEIERQESLVSHNIVKKETRGNSFVCFKMKTQE